MGEHDFGHFGDKFGMGCEVGDGDCHIGRRCGFTENIAILWHDFLHVGVADKNGNGAGLGFDEGEGVVIEIVGSEDVEVRVLDGGLDFFEGRVAVESDV